MSTSQTLEARPSITRPVPVDFGWRLEGRNVTLLKPRTLVLDLRIATSPVPCHQCGICTATCSLAEATQTFPRRALALLQVGHDGAARRSTAPWECHGCGDCTDRCPNQVRPGDVLAELRQRQVAMAARPGWLAAALGTWSGLAGATAVALVGVLALAGTTGQLHPAGPIRYAAFLPHGAIVPVFSGLGLFSLFQLALAGYRSWHGFGPVPAHDATDTLRAVVQVIREVFTHRRRRTCPDTKLPALAHAITVLGFVGLAALAGLVGVAVALGVRYPFDFDHPAKLAGNAFAAALIVGSAIALWTRLRGRACAARGTAFDVFLPAALFGSGVSGIALEILRATDASAFAYPTYCLHLALVVLLIGLAPYTKLAHAMHRFVALLHERLQARSDLLPERRVDPRQPGARIAVRRPVSARESHGFS